MGMKVLAYNQSLLWLSCGALGVLAATIILVDVGRPASLATPAEVPDEPGKIL